jgi:hypothetical protein
MSIEARRPSTPRLKVRCAAVVLSRYPAVTAPSRSSTRCDWGQADLL